MDNFGATFAPFPDPSGQNGSIAPIQQAVQMLSLRIPRVVGAAAPAPAALLNSPGSSGRPDINSVVLQTILRTIMGESLPMADQPPPASPVGPPPMANPGVVSGGGFPMPTPPPPPAPRPPSIPSPFTPHARDEAPRVEMAPPPSPHFDFYDSGGSTLPPEPPSDPAGGIGDTFGTPMAPPDQRSVPDYEDRRRNRML